MKNLSLNAKISFIIAVLIFGGSLVAYMGLTRMGMIKDMLVDIVDNDVKRDQLTSKIQDKQREVTILNQAIIIEKSLDRMRTLEKDLGTVRVDLYKLIDEYMKIGSEEGKAVAQKYREAVAKWVDVNEEVRNATKQGLDEKAQELVSKRQEPLRLETVDLLAKWNQLTAERLSHARHDSIDGYETAKQVVMIISLSSLILGLTLAFLILRSVSRAINQVINNLNDNSAQVTSAAQQIASSSEELSQAATEQASSLEETSSAVEEMSSMIKKNAEGAKTGSEVSHNSSDTAEKGKQIVNDMIEAMTEINQANGEIMSQIAESNQQISDIVKVISEIGNKTKVINDIVFQTKLLSFNASVEAARAGEHGKGFAVVAEEVGNLAQMSGNAAKEISEMLEGSIQKVESIVEESKSKIERLGEKGRTKVELGSEVAKKCGQVLDEIVGSVSNVTTIVGDIATASDEQAKGIEEITRAMNQLDQVTQQNAAVSEEAASAAEELSAQAESLRGVVVTLIHTIKGSRNKNESSQQNEPTRVNKGDQRPTISKIQHENQEASQVIHLGSKKPQKSRVGFEHSNKESFKLAVGGELIPSENDPRFHDA